MCKRNYARIFSALFALSGLIVFAEEGELGGAVYDVTPEVSLNEVLAKANNGDIIKLASGDYPVNVALNITNAVTIIGTGYQNCKISQTPGSSELDQDGSGRVIILNNANAVVKGVTISGGHISEYFRKGSGAQILKGHLTECRITGNSVGKKPNNPCGLGVSIEGADAKVSRSIIDGNFYTGSSRGGGVYISNGVIENSLVTGNGASIGGGIYRSGGKIINCTIVDNKSSTAGGGVHCENSKGAFIINCLFKGNEALSDSCWLTPHIGGVTTFEASCCTNCVFEELEVAGNVTGDIVFKDYGRGDYSLSAGSSAIDAGINDYFTEGSLDLAGNPRKLGGAVDVGCYEFNRDSVSCGFTLDSHSASQNELVVFRAHSSGLAEPVKYSWTIFNNTDQSEVNYETEGDLEFIPTQFGIYTVTLCASAANQSVSWSSENSLNVLSQICYVDPDSENPAFPYLNWQTAARTVKEAIEACSDGGEIILAKKVVPTDATVEITRPITLRGAGFREESILAGNGNGSVIKLSHKDAVVRQLTITGGKAPSGAGLYVTASGGLVEDCILSNNTANAGSYAYGGGAYLLGGRLSCSLVAENYATGGGSTPGVVLEGSAKMDRSFVVNHNHEQKNGWGVVQLRGAVTLENCVVAQNTVLAGVAGVCCKKSAKIVNCTIANNRTDNSADAEVGIQLVDNMNIINTIVAGNVNGMKEANVDESKISKSSIVNSLLTGDPQFMDRENDFRLKPSSPAIDAGTSEIDIPAVDVAGNPRKQGDEVDIGAYEMAPVFAVGFTAQTREGFSGTSFSPTPIIKYLEGQASFLWTVYSDTETFTSTEKEPTFKLVKPGWYNLSLRVMADGGDSSAEATEVEFFHVAPKVVFLKENAENPRYPYDTIDSAVGDFNTAWREIIDGGTLYISGKVTLPDTMNILKAVTVAGINGRDVDEVMCSGKNVIHLDNPRALVRGLKITGGRRGVLIQEKGGVVEDCIVENNGDNGSYTCGGGVYMSSDNAIVRRTIIRKNIIGSGENYHGGGGVFIKNGILESCIVAENTGLAAGDGVFVSSSAAKVRNCTIANNKHKNDRFGGGLYLYEAGAEIVNTLVYGNKYKETDIVRNWYAKYNEITNADGVKEKIPSFSVDELKEALSSCVFGEANNEKHWDIPEGCSARIIPAGELGVADDGSYRLEKDTPLRDIGVWQDWMKNALDVYCRKRVDRARAVDIGASEAEPTFGLKLIIR